jgi:hypothetical protein
VFIVVVIVVMDQIAGYVVVLSFFWPISIFLGFGWCELSVSLDQRVHTLVSKPVASDALWGDPAGIDAFWVVLVVLAAVLVGSVMVSLKIQRFANANLF